MSRKALLLTAAVLTLGPLFGVAAWACTPLPRSFMITPAVASARQATNVVGQGLAPGTPVEILWNGRSNNVIGMATADERGRFSLPVTVPEGKPGSYAIVFMAGDAANALAVGRLPFRISSSEPGTGAGTEAAGGAAPSDAGWVRSATRQSPPLDGLSGTLALGTALAAAGATVLLGGTASALVRRRASSNRAR